MPCTLRRDLSIILSTKQAQDLARCCSRPSTSLSQLDDCSSTSSPPSSATPPSADLVARVEEWLFKGDPVLPTSFFDLPRIESVVYPLTTANLWYLQGTLVGAEVALRVQDPKCSIYLPDTFCDTYSTSTSISYLVLDLKGISKNMPQQTGRERMKDVRRNGYKVESPKGEDSAMALDHSCCPRWPGRLICHGTY